LNVYPHDETPAIIGGDALIYMFTETIIFPAFIPYHTDEAGNTLNHFVGETISVTIVARVEGDSFYAKWAAGGAGANTALELGILIKDEVTARRLFPALGQYKFKGAFAHGSTSATHSG
jgi:hypothetical protein